MKLVAGSLVVIRHFPVNVCMYANPSVCEMKSTSMNQYSCSEKNIYIRDETFFFIGSGLEFSHDNNFVCSHLGTSCFADHRIK